MKQVLLLLSITISLHAVAQKNGPRVILTKGQKIIVKTTASQEADMGMGMEMKNFTSSQNNLSVLDAADSNYILSTTLTGMKISMDMMGQNTTYDSDKKEDSASEIGKAMQNLNVPDTVLLNKYTAAVTFNKKAAAVSAEEPNPLENMFESLQNTGENVASETFFVIPQGKKVGDKWIDSSSTKITRSLKEYVLKSVEKDIATILITSKVENNTQTELQGMQVTISMTTKSTGEIKVDSKTSLVNRREIKAEITGNLDMMGQSVPVTGKSTTTTEYQY